MCVCVCVCVCVCQLISPVRLFATPWTIARQAPLSWNSSGKSTGVGCQSLLQGIFPTQRSNLGSRTYFWILCSDLFVYSHSNAAAAKSLQSCPTLCDPIDRSPPGSPVPGILQARTLEWVAISFSNAWEWSERQVAQSCPTLATPWTAA